jgi:RNA polymerase sigma-70 factor (ECF subfamily)
VHDGRKRRRFEMLARPELDALFRMARRMTGDAGLAQDLVQDTASKPIRRFRRTMNLDRSDPWLFRILINGVVDHARHRKREAFGTRNAELIAAAQVDLELHSRPDRALASSETGRAIEAALAALPIDLRAVAILVLVEEASYADTAAALSITDDLVRSRLSRARDLLRQRLVEHNDPVAAQAVQHLKRGLE